MVLTRSARLRRLQILFLTLHAVKIALNINKNYTSYV